MRAGLPYAAVGGLLSMSFGVLARDAGFPVEAAIVMSAIVFAGSAQFAAVAILVGGGTAGAAVAAAALMNSRFLPMGVALGPSLPGRAPLRAAQGQTIVDASWAMANRGDGTFDRWFLFGSTAPQYVTWLGGTILGAVGGDLLGDTSRFGLDAIYPMFFLGLLIAEIKDRRTARVALAGGALAFAPRAARAARRAGAGRRAGGAVGPASSTGARMTSTIWWTIAGCTVVTAVIKAFGPVVMGGRELPAAPPGRHRAARARPARGPGGHRRPRRRRSHWHVGADTVGVLVGAAVLVLTRAGVLTAVLVAALVTALLRLIG